MATTRSTPVRKAWRSLTWLMVITVGLTALLGAGVAFWGWQWAPKLALDLQGGTQVILTPALETGQEVTQEQLDQAVSIIRQRVDATGVAEAEVSTQGDNIVVAIPGELDRADRGAHPGLGEARVPARAARRSPVDARPRTPRRRPRRTERPRRLRRRWSPRRA